jgi:hypothetical protein
MNSVRKIPWTIEDKDCERSLRTDSTDDENNDDRHEHLKDLNLNCFSEIRKYSET